jgi:hypothetical protein
MISGTPFHLDIATGRYFFTKVQDAEVDRNMIVRAEDVREFVCADLRIELPKIVWIRPAPPTSKSGPLKQNYQEELDAVVRLQNDTPGGVTPSNYSLREIWIRSDLTARPALEYAVAHELRHVWQKKHCRDVFQDECRAEGDAYPYGYEVLKRYLELRGGLSTELREEIDEKRARAGAVYRDRWPVGTFEAIQCDPP